MSVEENNFIKYVRDYYITFIVPGTTHFTVKEIKQAIKLLEVTVVLEHDSVDRERVRDIILIQRGLEPIGF